MKKTIMLILPVMCFMNLCSGKVDAQVFKSREISEEVVKYIPDGTRKAFIEKRIKAFREHMKYARSNSSSFEKKKGKFISDLCSRLSDGLNICERYILNSSETGEEYLKNLQTLIITYESEQKSEMRRKR